MSWCLLISVFCTGTIAEHDWYQTDEQFKMRLQELLNMAGLYILSDLTRGLHGNSRSASSFGSGRRSSRRRHPGDGDGEDADADGRRCAVVGISQAYTWYIPVIWILARYMTGIYYTRYITGIHTHSIFQQYPCISWYIRFINRFMPGSCATGMGLEQGRRATGLEQGRATDPEPLRACACSLPGRQ